MTVGYCWGETLTVLFKEKKKDQNLLGQNASHILPQLSAWENRLSCTIEGVEQNRLLICFTNVCALQPQDKVSFVLDIAAEPFKGLYKALLCCSCLTFSQ